MKHFIISITGMQNLNGPENDGIEFVTDGEYSYSDSEITCSYMESAITGLEGTKTTFTITNNLVTLTREGTFPMHMIFQEGKKHYFAYETPFGAVTMGIDTHSISYSLGENGGNLKIHYLISMESSAVSRNIFVINIKEA